MIYIIYKLCCLFDFSFFKNPIAFLQHNITPSVLHDTLGFETCVSSIKSLMEDRLKLAKENMALRSNLERAEKRIQSRVFKIHVLNGPASEIRKYRRPRCGHSVLGAPELRP